MVKRILTAAGLVENQTFRECRFLKPPKTSYAVFFDTVQRRGSDEAARIKNHSITIELYEYAPDPTVEQNIETQLDAAFSKMLTGWAKSERVWIESEQLYQVIYSFEYIEK